MKKKLLVLGGIVVVVALVLGLSAILKDRSVANEGLCAKFILAVEEGDAEVSYDFFSQHAKNDQPLGDWKTLAKSLKTQYYDSDIERTKTSSSTDSITQQTVVKDTYKIHSGSGPYAASCTTVVDDGNERIDSFTSDFYVPDGN